MKETRPIRVLLVDPSLFTAPYDAALTEGLVAAGVQPTWAIRPTRDGDRQEIAPEYVDEFFYRRVDGMTFLPGPLRALAKGMAHALGLAQLVLRVLAKRPDVVHFQWLVVPPLDALAIRIIAAHCPVVFTVHDTVPFNGDQPSLLQKLAFDLPIRLSDRVIVHTEGGRERLRARGVPDEKLAVIPHGPLKLPAAAPAPAPAPPSSPLRPRRETDARMTFLAFGEIKRYKGPDVLIEAAGLLPPALRARARFIIAGRPRMDMAPLRARAAALDLQDTLEIWPRRLSEPEMADLFEQTDCFVFPYRQIDASGVYFLTKSSGKWIIASRVGIFAEDVKDGTQGQLVAPENPEALAAAIVAAIRDRPAPRATSSDSAWLAIGHATCDVYRQARPRAA
ncbi:MAG TPA: glycosyltransferase [Polyangia bacterium]|jgi:glycosyltransferase involved in cell wall biosynthesis|nr:glycosyltransferase [Polyangia bacterium]